MNYFPNISETFQQEETTIATSQNTLKQKLDWDRLVDSVFMEERRRQYAKYINYKKKNCQYTEL